MSKAQHYILPYAFRLLSMLFPSVVTIAVGQPAFGGERLGQLRLSELVVEPFFEIDEGQEAQINLRNSYLGVEWIHEERWRAHLKIGQQVLRGFPAKFGAGDVDLDQLGLVEGYGEVSGRFGRGRFGLLPISFGVEGGDREPQLVLSRSLLFSQRLVPLRDFGGEYKISHGGFHTSLAVHNGEAGGEKDNQIWYSGHWRWQKRQWNVGFSATTGNSDANSTFQVGNPASLTVFDPQESAHWRLALFFVEYQSRPWRVVIEAYSGRVEQSIAGNSEFHGGHVDLFYGFSPEFSGALRFDILEPDIRTEGGRFEEWSAALVWHNKYRTSQLIAEAVSKSLPNSGEGVFRLSWRLSPQANTR